MFFRFLIIALIAVLIVRQFRKLFQPSKPDTKVKGGSESKPRHNLRNVEDADFEDLD